MKNYTSYIACVSIVLAGLVTSDSSEAKAWNLFKHNKQTVEDSEQSPSQVNGSETEAKKRHRFSFGHGKKHLIEDQNSKAFDVLNTTATKKNDKGLGMLLERREKIDKEIMKKVGNFDVDKYIVVDKFIEELTKNALVAIELANSINDVKGKLTYINYISKLYLLAQAKQWNEFKHGLTDFGNITFASTQLNSLKNNVLSGIKTLFAKYFSSADIDAATNSEISNDKNDLQDRLCIESPKELTINDDTKSMLDSLTNDVVIKKTVHRGAISPISHKIPKTRNTKSIARTPQLLALDTQKEDVYVPEINSDDAIVVEDVTSPEVLNNQSFGSTKEIIAEGDDDIGYQSKPGASLSDELTLEQLLEDNEEEKNNTVGKISDPSIAVDDLSFAEKHMLFEKKAGND